MTAETRRILQRIENSCTSYQTYARKPQRFKFTLRDDVNFNHSVYVNIFYRSRKAILYVADEATRYQASQWLLAHTEDGIEATCPDTTGESLRRALRLRWINVYLGPPDIILPDAEKNIHTHAFQTNSSMLHIATKSVPVEAAYSMSIVGRYLDTLRRAFFIMKEEAPTTTDTEVLQMLIKAVNDSGGPDRLVPTLLVHSALPRLVLPRDLPTPSIYQRAIALWKPAKAMTRNFSKRQVCVALATRNGPSVTDIHRTPISYPVLVYRP